MILDPVMTGTTLEVGDMVRHPKTGHVGLLLSQDSDGIWTVEWFATKKWTMMKRSVRTMEYDAFLFLVAKAQAA